MKTTLFLLCIFQVVLISMGSHTHWMQLTIYNETPEDLVISRSHLVWGKWYDCGLSKWDIRSNPHGWIRTGESVRVCASGAQGSWSGTEGSFVIQEVGPFFRLDLCQVHFDIPFIGSTRLAVEQFSEFKRQRVFNYTLFAGDLTGNKLPHATLTISYTEAEKRRLEAERLRLEEIEKRRLELEKALLLQQAMVKIVEDQRVANATGRP